MTSLTQGCPVPVELHRHVNVPPKDKWKTVFLYKNLMWMNSMLYGILETDSVPAVSCPCEGDDLMGRHNRVVRGALSFLDDSNLSFSTDNLKCLIIGQASDNMTTEFPSWFTVLTFQSPIYQFCIYL